MKALDTEFKEKGFSFQQIAREGNFAIYKRWKEEEEPHFEVIRITSHNGFTAPNGKIYPPAEMYPTAAKWGVNGFTVESKDRAFEVMKKLIESMTNEQNNEEVTVAVLANEVTNEPARPKIPGRGRKSIPFAFPTGEFKIKTLAEQLNVSVPLIHIKIKEAGAKIERVGEEKVPGQKGRAAGVYRYVADKASTPAQAEEQTPTVTSGDGFD